MLPRQSETNLGFCSPCTYQKRIRPRQQHFSNWIRRDAASFCSFQILFSTKQQKVHHISDDSFFDKSYVGTVSEFYWISLLCLPILRSFRLRKSLNKISIVSGQWASKIGHKRVECNQLYVGDVFGYDFSGFQRDS